eukprot:12065797-Alexandrium_andersonii.AAC.1
MSELRQMAATSVMALSSPRSEGTRTSKHPWESVAFGNHTLWWQCPSISDRCGTPLCITQDSLVTHRVQGLLRQFTLACDK